MTAMSRGNVFTIQLAMRMVIALVLAVLAVGSLSIAAAGAQSAGCTGGPYDGATAADSDGDGVDDGTEVRAGTDECNPNSTPTSVCGDWVANYNPATADTDADGHTDAAETTAGSDPCDASSVVAAAAATQNTGTVAAAPQLALTGPSTAIIIALTGLSMMMIGFAALAVGRRVEAS